MPSSNPRARYVALARLPRVSKPLIEYVGEPGESRADVEAHALASLAAACAPYPSYATVEVVTYSTAEREYRKDLDHYAWGQEVDRLRAAACGSSEGATR